MTSLPAPLIRELEAALGAEAVLSDEAALMTYECDALMTHRALPRAVLLPSTTEHVAAAARLLSAANIPYVPRGAGTGLSGGALALKDAVVLSLARMNRILEVDLDNARARVQPGVVNAHLAEKLLPHGFAYAPDPSSQAVCTLGGNVAENAGGPHCLKYGTTVNHVTALTVVMPDGEVLKLGGPGESEGFDLVGLFVGSEGTFGVATEIEVRLIRLPEEVSTLLAIFPTVEGAGATASAFIRAGIVPAALELIDRETIHAVEGSPYAAGYPKDAECALIVELDGAKASLPRLTERAREICLSGGATELRIALDEAERQRLWQGRKKAYAVVARLAPDVLIQDLVVPRARLPEMFREIYRVTSRDGLRVVNVAHLGDGNIHPSLLYDRRRADEVERVEAASNEMLRACVALGGSITGEHGVGLDKRDHMGLQFRDVELNLMCDVRRAFNPRDVLNPRKVLPTRNCREWVGS